jgi:glutaredoxin
VSEQSPLVLLTRTDCHLCDEARELLGRLGIAFATIDVDGDAALGDRYGDAVPVLLHGSAEIGRAPLSERRLMSALRRAGIASGA